MFERSGEMQQIGAGITLWANAVKALKRLGVYNERTPWCWGSA
jgi:2-polyprenyl-6-methoxyphenol hydroxylase-like FAD-dependent oxidoreductase